MDPGVFRGCISPLKNGDVIPANRYVRLFVYQAGYQAVFWRAFLGWVKSWWLPKKQHAGNSDLFICSFSWVDSKVSKVWNKTWLGQIIATSHDLTPKGSF